MIAFRLFQLLVFVLYLFPYRWRRRFYAFLARVAYAVDGKHKRVIRQNLDFAFDGTLDAAEIETIGRYCYRNAAFAFTQVIENRVLSPEAIGERVRFENRAPVDAAVAAGRPVIFVTAHYGNWEIAGAAISNFLIPITVIYRKLNNPHFDRYLYESRRAIGIETVEKSGAARALAKILKSGGAVTLLTDQNTSRRDGVAVKFFGKTVHQTATPAFLARKYDAALIPLYTTTEDDEYYTVTFGDPIEVAKSDDAERDVFTATQAQAQCHETAIRMAPKFWFWCHRRWKTDHPEIYRKP